MSPTDLSDLSSTTLTCLMNGTTPAGNWTGLLRPGERVRPRFINGAGKTFYDVRMSGLKQTVLQVDILGKAFTAHSSRFKDKRSQPDDLPSEV